MLKPKGSQSSGGTYIHQTSRKKKFKQTSVCQKTDGNYFLGQGRSADGGIHAKMDDNNVTSVLRNTKKLHRAIQSKRRGMLTHGVVLLCDNARSHTAARTRALLEYLNWELFDCPYSHDLATSDYHLFTYLTNWLGSQRFNNNELMEGVKTCVSSQAADLLVTDRQELIPRYDKCLNSGGDDVEK
jgi:hypothetical protein